MERRQVIESIRQVGLKTLPPNSILLLFGSQARGDSGKDSDWDLLVLLDKKQLMPEDHDRYSYPFWELGWKIDAMIHPSIYTEDDWRSKVNPVFRGNVEKDGIVLC